VRKNIYGTAKTFFFTTRHQGFIYETLCIGDFVVETFLNNSNYLFLNDRNPVRRFL